LGRQKFSYLGKKLKSVYIEFKEHMRDFNEIKSSRDGQFFENNLNQKFLKTLK
jgi:hypothetical protein